MGGGWEEEVAVTTFGPKFLAAADCHGFGHWQSSEMLDYIHSFLEYGTHWWLFKVFVMAHLGNRSQWQHKKAFGNIMTISVKHRKPKVDEVCTFFFSAVLRARTHQPMLMKGILLIRRLKVTSNSPFKEKKEAKNEYQVSLSFRFV